MPFRAKSFDVILISEVLEHIPPEIIPQMFSESEFLNLMEFIKKFQKSILK